MKLSELSPAAGSTQVAKRKGRGHGTALRCGDSGSTREIWRLGIERVTAINLCREDLTNFKVCRIMFEGFYFANFDLL